LRAASPVGRPFCNVGFVNVCVCVCVYVSVCVSVCTKIGMS